MATIACVFSFTTRAALNTDELEPRGGLTLLGASDGAGSPLQSVSRASSRARSGRSIHWALTTYRNIHVDKKVLLTLCRYHI